MLVYVCVCERERVNVCVSRLKYAASLKLLSQPESQIFQADLKLKKFQLLICRSFGSESALNESRTKKRRKKEQHFC